MTVDLNRQFLERVVVWPGSKDDPGWLNLHCHMKNTDPAKNDGKPFVLGWPFKTVNDFISRAKWVDTTDTFFDVWFCTSLQKEMGKNSKGNPKAIRLHRNALSLRAIWIDCDVKPDDATGKHYLTLQDAWAAISAFRQKVGLPRPSALVNSGGGLHVYWISDTPLSPQEWRPYAEGLKQLLLAEGVKCDTGLTTDDVRILRVPGTLNHKYDPPRKVEVLHLGRDYNFQSDLTFLTLVSPSQKDTSQSGIADQASVMDPGFTATAPAAAFAALTGGGELQAGIAASGPTLVDPAPIFRECGFMRHAFATGGVDYDNPLWNLSVLCTAFMENGNVFAHEISKGHPTYSPADTQALYDRKVADRHERGVGYPSCATIAGAGCKSCATCPHFPKGKSPLNLRAPKPAAQAVTATVNTRQPRAPSAHALHLPDGYDLDDNGIINYIEEKATKNGDSIEVWRPLFKCRIADPWAQKDPDIIHFRVSRDKGNDEWTQVRHEDWCGTGYEKKLAVAKVRYHPANKMLLETFFMSWLEKMFDASVAVTPQAFGWFYEAGVRRGFAYGGFVYLDNKTQQQAGMTDRRIQKRFQPTGQLQAWYDAARCITIQKRPELDTIIAASFAAPLMELAGCSGAVLSTYGESGSGKTFAAEVGAAVWGHPKLTKEQTGTTWKSLESRLGSTVNLMVLWDEIHDREAQVAAGKVVMLTTGGVQRGRLHSNGEQREKDTWSTILLMNSNLCFKDYLASTQQTHTAGLNRVFEYKILKDPGHAGQMSPSTADQLLLNLQHNYGNVGLDYARMLGEDHEAIHARVAAVLQDLETKLRPTPDDRFWVAITGCLLVGAELANRLNAGLDLPAMEAFLLREFQNNRANRTDANTQPNTQTYAEDYLTAFMKEHTMATIWTDGSAQQGAGRGAHVGWTRQFVNAPLPAGVVVRFDKGDMTLRFSVKKFADWCAAQKPTPISASEIAGSWKRNYGMVRARRSLGAGTTLGGGQEYVYEIKVTGHQDLEDLMNSQNVNNRDLGASNGMTANAVDTGIATPQDPNAPPP